MQKRGRGTKKEKEKSKPLFSSPGDKTAFAHVVMLS